VNRATESAALTISEVSFGSADYERSLRLRNEILRHPLGRELDAADLAGEDCQKHLIAQDATGQLLGCVVLKPIDEQHCKLRQMAVSAAAQGRGIGAALVAAAEDLASSGGASRIDLAARDTATGFYQRCGYVVTSDLFTEIGIPHRMMSKSLA